MTGVRVSSWPTLNFSYIFFERKYRTHTSISSEQMNRYLMKRDNRHNKVENYFFSKFVLRL